MRSIIRMPDIGLPRPKLIDLYEKLTPALRLEFFDFLAGNFNPDPQRVMAAAQAYQAAPTAQHLTDLFQVVEQLHQLLQPS